MNKKIAFIMIGIISISLLLGSYFNIMLQRGFAQNFLDYGRIYQWKYVMRLAFNEWTAFSVGSILVLGGFTHKETVMRVLSYVLLLTIVVLIVYALFLGFSLQPTPFLTTEKANINQLTNTAYLVYAVMMVVYSVVAIVLGFVKHHSHKLLLILISALVIMVYVQAIAQYGWLQSYVSVNMYQAIYYVLLYVINYPLTIAIYILFTYMYFKEYKKV